MSSLSERGGIQIRTVAVLVALSMIAVMLRIFARFKRRVGFGVDDYLCFISLFLMIGMLIELSVWCTVGGNGRHQADLSVGTMMTFFKVFLANQFTYFALCPLIKISIICFYRRVFTIPIFQKISFGLNCLIGSWGAAIFIACGLQCRPLRSYWDKTVDGKCFDGQLFIIVNQVFNVAMDFVILGLPVPMIWNLQRHWRDKLALNGVFAIGAFVCFASIYRIVTLFWMHPQDTTWTIFQASLWTHIEPSVGLICSCLPIIRGLFPKLKLQSSSGRKSSMPYYINTALSKSHFTMSSPKSPASDYYMMSDTPTSRASDRDAPKIDYSPGYLGPMDITVRTDIEVDAASTKSHT